ncbi:aldehyde dehydrogenase (NADP(+)) [Maribacter hydrothermalis]|uniref:Aldehyde dehydrogenase n=1 Tax=Maribacter hydrothermalis TaxID=1836467 RepID=A0A1B7Z1Y7_9FLAO|nr:aldehyde dehydrogenase (NADP(+)) [Maribacter hydrothermalis]APQ18352.1 aldehyde dehydrogenase (NADP(+)) [Maribacter hydrothermalis]OBR36698.1 aldehyde dehydrogenase [Maribacter hydrothermalis]
MISGKNTIGNKLSKQGDITFKTFNPKENKPTEWTFYEASSAEINEAVELATSAFKIYKNVTGIKKAEFLEAIATEIETLGEELILIYCKESGLPEGRARGERGRTMGQLRAFAALLKDGSWVEAVIEKAQPNRDPMPKSDIRKMLFPIGPVVVFGASNFPLAFSTAGGDTASALAAGCPVIVKSHPMHAATGELVSSAVIKAAEKTGMPNGVFSNLNSSGITVGQQLVKHPKVKAVGFTGSIAGGTALYKLANERVEPIPVFAEMGSINPIVVLPSALEKERDEWAAKYASSITMGAGQFCTNPGLVLGVKSKNLDDFITTLSAEILKLEPTCMLHPNIYAKYNEGKKELSGQNGVTVTADYEKDVGANEAKQTILNVSGADFLANTKLHTEVFGPFSVVVSCKNTTEIETILNHLEGQLTGTVLGSEDDLAAHSNVVDALQSRVGRILFNGVPTGVEVNSSMVHGGPFPASTDSRFTSVGTSAIKRWVRPVSFQDWPNKLLPQALQNENPLGIVRLEEGSYTN